MRRSAQRSLVYIEPVALESVGLTGDIEGCGEAPSSLHHGLSRDIKVAREPYPRNIEKIGRSKIDADKHAGRGMSSALILERRAIGGRHASDLRLGRAP